MGELVRSWPFRWATVSQTSSPSVVLGSSSTASLLLSPSWRRTVLERWLRQAWRVACSDHGFVREVFCRLRRHFSGSLTWMQVRQELGLVPSWSTRHRKKKKKKQKKTTSPRVLQEGCPSAWWRPCPC